MTQKAFSLAFVFLVSGLVAGCGSDRPLRTPEVGQAIRAELQPPAQVKPVVAVPAYISESLAEPAPAAQAAAPEPRLDLLVNNAQAREVFLAVVADTRYSMMLHPDVAGTLSVTLRGVTVTEALEAIRDVYGFDFKIDGRRITVYAPTLQTRMFTVNYPHSQRVGSSEMRVAPGAALQAAGVSSPGSTGATATPGGSQSNEGSRVTTSTRTDFWTELSTAVQGLIAGNKGASVVVSPQAGIMAVRAMPDELRQVDAFLKAAQIAIERQVMLEAKIVEVQLRDGYQSGIDWSGLRNSGNSTGAIGTIGGNTNSPINSPPNTITSTNSLVRGVQPNIPGLSAGAALLADLVSLPSAGSGIFGLAFATEGFQAILGFLETQGDVQILSSPRIATLNNQKAVLKVGTEDFYVTNVSSDSGNSGNSAADNTVSMPSITLTPFFSGISLDVTPQIDGGNNIMLHVHPSVSKVDELTKQIDLGRAGNYLLPLASSKMNESDTLVRVQDGYIVAIGGLMQIESSRKSSGFPGTTDMGLFSNLFGNKVNTGRKIEVVVLIKPTIIRTAQDWETQTRRTRDALDDMDAVRARVIRIDGSVVTAPAKNTAQ